jgi:hypothetical protein
MGSEARLSPQTLSMTLSSAGSGPSRAPGPGPPTQLLDSTWPNTILSRYVYRLPVCRMPVYQYYDGTFDGPTGRFGTELAAFSAIETGVGRCRARSRSALGAARRRSPPGPNQCAESAMGTGDGDDPRSPANRGRGRGRGSGIPHTGPNHFKLKSPPLPLGSNIRNATSTAEPITNIVEDHGDVPLVGYDAADLIQVEVIIEQA